MPHNNKPRRLKHSPPRAPLPSALGARHVALAIVLAVLAFAAAMLAVTLPVRPASFHCNIKVDVDCSAKITCNYCSLKCRPHLRLSPALVVLALLVPTALIVLVALVLVAVAILAVLAVAAAVLPVTLPVRPASYHRNIKFVDCSAKITCN